MEHNRRVSQPEQQPQQKQQQPRQLPLPATQTRPQQPIFNVEPPDPFEHDSYLNAQQQQESHPEDSMKGYIVDDDSDGEQGEGGGDSQFFPGSGLFGSK
jgi:hypothetical protein